MMNKEHKYKISTPDAVSRYISAEIPSSTGLRIIRPPGPLPLPPLLPPLLNIYSDICNTIFLQVVHLYLRI